MNDPDSFRELPPEIQAYIRDLEARNAKRSARVRQLEEQFRMAQLKRYAPSSEKRSERVFNEAEQMGRSRSKRPWPYPTPACLMPRQ